MSTAVVRFEQLYKVPMKSNEIRPEEQNVDKLENVVLKERLLDENGLQHYVYQADGCALHIKAVVNVNVNYSRH